MGGHYGSIHFRTDDGESIRAAVSQLAQERKMQFYIAPPIKGWVSIFPWNNGQDSSIADRVVELLPEAEFIQCLVHDDDIFAYWYYRKTALIDRYNSCPTYFDDKSTETRGGNAKALEHLLAKAGTLSDLQSLLDEEHYDFEMMRLEKFAKLLDLPNAVTAYEYLQGGERDGIRQWKKFVHIPDLADEKAARREQEAAIKVEMKRLMKEGVLLSDSVGPKTSSKLFPAQPIWCVHPADNDVLLAWQYANRGAPDAGIPLLRVSASSPSASQLGISLPATMHSMIISHSGKWLAVGCASGDWQVQLWNLETGAMCLGVPQPRSGKVHCFSPDDKRLFIGSEGTISIVSTDDLKVTGTIHLDGHIETLALHPDGKTLAVVDNFGLLLVVSLETSRVVTQTWIKQLESELPEAVWEAMMAQAKESFTEVMKSHLSAAQMEKHQRDSQRHYLPKDPIRTMTFSADGKWLFCGTRDGMHVLAWEDVTACPDMAEVKPRNSVIVENTVQDLRGGMTTKSRLTYDVLIDEPRQRVLFCGVDGKIRFFELAGGRSGVLLVPPEPLPMWQLGLLPDRSRLVCTVRRLDLKKHWPPHFQMWSYPTLCRAAGIPH